MGLRKISMLAVVWFALLVRSNAEEQESEQERRPIKTFKTNYGEIIDCINIYKQPAFDHPLLKDHKLQFAFLDLLSAGSPMYGAKAFIDNYIPRCENGQYSGAQMWIFTELDNQPNSIEAGWRVDPCVYNDSQSHLFIYWKYSGATHTSQGMAFPAMGSGYFPDNSYSHACYIRQIQYLLQFLNESQGWNMPEYWRASAHTSSKHCYGVAVDDANDFMRYTLLFGGPGGANCGV
ncbi:uncharacterized protein LOC130139934 [Syzygium oleosum]|uniref:uncharacterized protein LOC130139934 n=1 Tax=Syzygium oleosum TaxID=219896 RepID=UPI0024BA2DF2|nr:uncharacterized protein LOC130139934 [Syzygium oleosum]